VAGELLNLFQEGRAASEAGRENPEAGALVRPLQRPVLGRLQAVC
jgi:hypothetical protein